MMKRRFTVTAIIPAAGTGRRMGGEKKKQYLLLDDKPILVHTIENLTASQLISTFILVVPQEEQRYCANEIVGKYSLRKVTNIVCGGAQRQDSVFNALAFVPESTDIIMVHDGVRPLVSTQIIYESITAAGRFGASVCAIPAKDTIKEVDGEGVVIKTLDRKKLWHIQTPQTFKKDVLINAFKDAHKKQFYGTDEASLVEAAGGQVTITTGSVTNIKITVPEDIAMAEYFIKGGYHHDCYNGKR